jgi:cytochrome bd-type quinol oxidase subunit 2
MNNARFAIEFLVYFMIAIAILSSVGMTIALAVEKRKGKDIGWTGLISYTLSLLSISLMYMFVHFPRVQ